MAAFALNLVFGQFHAGFGAQPIAHSDQLWNFLGMVLSGWAFVLAGGCPGRHFFLAGEGDGGSAIFIMGMLVGAGFAHNFYLASVPDKVVGGSLVVGGPEFFGQIAVILGLLFCAVLGWTARADNRTA